MQRRELKASYNDEKSLLAIKICKSSRRWVACFRVLA